MCKCCCNCLNNLMARIVYTILIGGLCTISLLLCFDTGYISGPLFGINYENETQVMLVQKSTSPLAVKTPIFGIKYPGYTQLLTTSIGDCIAYLTDLDDAIPAGKVVSVHKTENGHPIPWDFMKEEAQELMCQESKSYDYTSQNWYFENLNWCIFWSIIAVSVVIAFMLIGVWLCCFGWCGCRCCAICQMGCSEQKTESRTVEVRYV